MSYVKILFYDKRLFYRCIQNEHVYCNSKLNLARYTNCIQSMFYSTHPRMIEENEDSKNIDPRVEALKDKLLYCDYLHSEKVKMGHVEYFEKEKYKRLHQRKLTEEKLTFAPVHSVTAKYLFDSKQDNTEDPVLNATSDSKERTEHSKEAESNDAAIHMPYARVDKYETANNTDSKIETESKLNEDIKILYAKYLKLKETNPELTKDLDFQSYVSNEILEKELNDEYESEFDDKHLNIPFNWMMDYEYCDNPIIDYSSSGTPNPNIEISKVPCGGCGALLHCQDKEIPGYIPSELFVRRNESELKSMICQRCHFLKNYNTALEVKVSADVYPELLKVIKTKKCAVVLLVDLTDFPCSIWPDIKSILNPMTPIFIVGNKIDLLPPDSGKFFDHVKESLRRYVEATGVNKKYIRHISLVSAKTGYGIEELIDNLNEYWTKGDVYVIGCTNVGKSSLFNRLIQSDYCKSQAVHLIQRATISPWPGTTLNMLKFPIMKMNSKRYYMRKERLRDQRIMNETQRQEMKKNYKLNHDIKYVTLRNRVVRTEEISYEDIEENPFLEKSHRFARGELGLNEDSPEYQKSRWCYDTPGTIQPDQVLDLLTTEELMLTLPRMIIQPRTFIMKPKQTLFLAGLGRLDFIEGDNFIRCTVFASRKLPVTMCHTADADEVYSELLYTPAFVVPTNNPKRLEMWPKLGSKEINLVGIDRNESVADIVLSSGGWIAVTPDTQEHVVLKAWTPEGRGIHLRTPALLRKSVHLRGNKVMHLPAYRKGKMVYVE